MAMINAIWPFILMGGIFYFMLYRPQKQEQQKRQRMLDSLKKGDKVVTVGGMFGVNRKQPQSKQLFCLKQMPDIGPRKITASITAAAFINRAKILSIRSISYNQPSFWYHCCTVTRYPCRKHTVKHINTKVYCLHYTVRCSNAH